MRANRTRAGGVLGVGKFFFGASFVVGQVVRLHDPQVDMVGFGARRTRAETVPGCGTQRARNAGTIARLVSRAQRADRDL